MARIYIKTVMKWLIGSGLVGLTGVLLLTYLSNLGVLTINSYNWSKVCAGTPEDKCWAEINFTVNNDTFIYPSENWSYMFNTDKEIKNLKIYRNWGIGWREIKLNQTCTGTWCGAPNNKGVAYAFALRKGKNYVFKFEAEKYSSYEDIKWGFEKIDPIWEGINQLIIIPINYQTNKISLGNNRFKQESYLGFENYFNGSEFLMINTTIIPYNQNGYDYAVLAAPYKLYFKNNSNWGDGTKFCVKDGIDYCLIYQSQDYSYRNQYGSQDYISNIQNSQAIINDSIFTYLNIHSNVSLTMIAQNGMIKENYKIESKPRNPAGYLGNNVTLDFGGYIKFPDLKMYVNNTLMEGNFKTSERIEFRNDGKDLFYISKPIAYDSNGSQIDLSYEVKKQGNQIWFYVRIPYSWLNDSSRIYPVYIDPSIGPNSPGTVVDDATVGTVAWSNPNNAKVADNVFSTAILNPTIITHYLKATNFSFSIPAGATINGILVEVDCGYASYPDSMKDYQARIIKSDGSIGSTERASSLSWSNSYWDVYISHGNSTDLWGESWTPSDVNDSDFGFALSAYNVDASNTDTARIDHIRITVDYTEADITPPIVTILSPTNSTYTFQTIPFNVSLDEAGSTCLLELDKTTNITMTKDSNNLNFNWTNLTDAGSHNARFYCNDTLNNMNLSGLNNVTFYINLAPFIQNISITPTTAYTNSLLNCSADYGHPTGLKSNITLSWYNGSTEYWKVTQLNKISGEAVNEPLTWINMTGLVAFWKFSEGNGTIAYDLSGNNINAYLINGTSTNTEINAPNRVCSSEKGAECPAWNSSGKYGYGISLFGNISGTDRGGHIISNFSDKLDVRNFTAVTYNVWVNPNKLLPLSNDLILVGSRGYMGLIIRNISGDGSGRCKIILSNDSLRIYSAEISNCYESGSWFMLTGTWDSVTTNMILWKDAIPIASRLMIANPITGTLNQTCWFSSTGVPNGCGRVAMGTTLGGSGGTYYTLNGTIDEVGIWNRSLSQDEITALYQNSPQNLGETWNCTINATDSQGMAGNPNSTTKYINDSCVYSSGAWYIDFADNCVISSPINVGTNNIYISGSGTLTLLADVNVKGKVQIVGVSDNPRSKVLCKGGCFKS